MKKILLLLLLFPIVSCAKNSNQLKEIGRIIDYSTWSGEERLSEVIIINSSPQNIEYIETKLGKEATITIKDTYYEDFNDQKPTLKPNFSASSSFTTTDRKIKFVEDIWNSCFDKNDDPEAIIDCAFVNRGIIYENPSFNESIALLDYSYQIDSEDITGESVQRSFNKVIKFINQNSSLKLKVF